MRVTAILVCLVMLRPGFAEEPPRAAEQQSLAHYEAGRRFYKTKDYRAAIREFTEGYRLAPRPLFLANIGQAHRQLLEYENARVAYRRYLTEAPPDDPFRGQASELLAEVERVIVERDRSQAVTPVVALTPPALRSAPSSTRWSTRKHLGWIVPTAVVVTTGLVVGVYFGVRPASTVGCDDASFGCVRAP